MEIINKIVPFLIFMYENSKIGLFFRDELFIIHHAVATYYNLCREITLGQNKL